MTGQDSQAAIASDGASYVHRIPVRWRDLDALGHVNYATYLTYLEEARDAWLTKTVGFERGMAYVVAGVKIQYRSEITLADDPVSVSVSVVGLGRSSMSTSERVLAAGGRLAAEAEVAIVFWDGDHRRSRPMSAEERALLEPVGSQ